MRADIAVVLGVLCCAAVARADPEAKRLFDEGRELLDRGKVDEACKRFAQSLERERAGGTMLNLADCAERTGQLARAWSLYDEAAREYERTNKGTAEKFARGRAIALEPKLATVIVRVAEPDTKGLVVTIDDDDVTPIAKILRFHDPGSLTVTARAPGRVRFETTAEAVAGKKVTVEVPDLERRARERDEPIDPKQPAPRSTPWRVALWTSIGTGVVGGAVWFYGWRQIVDAERQLEVGIGDRDEYISQGSRGRTLSYVGAGVLTASVVVVGVSLYMGGRSDRTSGRARSSDRAARAPAPIFSPVLSPSAIGLAMTAGF
jgi:hypothetical protein